MIKYKNMYKCKCGYEYNIVDYYNDYIVRTNENAYFVICPDCDKATKFIIPPYKKGKRDNIISIAFICKMVAEYLDVKQEVLHKKTRKRDIVQARQIAMYFSKTYTNASLSTIGYEIGGKDHSTVLHACRTIDDLIFSDKSFRKMIGDIERKLNS